MDTKYRLNCWEYMNCGREQESSTMGVCPAVTEENFDTLNNGINGGRFCWRTAGTLCFEKIQGTIARHIESCSNCPFYLMVKKEEGPYLHDPIY